MRRATPRDDALVRRARYLWNLVLEIIVLAAVVFLCVFVIRHVYQRTHYTSNVPARYHTMEPLTYTRTKDPDDTIYVYVITDPDYGKQYLVSDHGGMCERDRSTEVNGDSEESS